MPQTVTVTGATGRTQTIADVPAGGLFVGADGDVWMRSGPKGNLIMNLRTGATMVSRGMSERTQAGWREDRRFDNDHPVTRVLPAGSRVTIET